MADSFLNGKWVSRSNRSSCYHIPSRYGWKYDRSTRNGDIYMTNSFPPEAFVPRDIDTNLVIGPRHSGLIAIYRGPDEFWDKVMSPNPNDIPYRLVLMKNLYTKDPNVLREWNNWNDRMQDAMAKRHKAIEDDKVKQDAEKKIREEIAKRLHRFNVEANGIKGLMMQMDILFDLRQQREEEMRQMMEAYRVELQKLRQQEQDRQYAIALANNAKSHPPMNPFTAVVSPPMAKIPRKQRGDNDNIDNLDSFVGLSRKMPTMTVNNKNNTVEDNFDERKLPAKLASTPATMTTMMTEATTPTTKKKDCNVPDNRQAKKDVRKKKREERLKNEGPDVAKRRAEAISLVDEQDDVQTDTPINSRSQKKKKNEPSPGFMTLTQFCPPVRGDNMDEAAFLRYEARRAKQHAHNVEVQQQIWDQAVSRGKQDKKSNDPHYQDMMRMINSDYEDDKDEGDSSNNSNN